MADPAAADERAGAALQSLGNLRQLDTDLVTGQQPGLGGLGERYPRAYQQRLDAGDRRLHRLGDLLVGQGVHLAQDERRLLGLRKLMDVADEQPELLALVDLVGGAGAVLGKVVIHRVDADRLDSAQMIEAAVAGDPVQPGPDVDWPVVGENRVERGGQDLLEDVLGVFAGPQEVAAEGHQARLIPGHQDLERRHVAAPEHRDQPIVGLQPEQGRAPMQADTSGVFERRDFH